MAKKKRSKKHGSADAAGYVSPGIREKKSRGYVVVELRHDSQVSFSPSGFAGPAAAAPQTRGLNQVLNSYRLREVASHFGLSAAQIRKRSTAAPPSLEVPVSAGFAHAGFARIVPAAEKDLASLVKRLNRSEAVWKATIGAATSSPARATCMTSPTESVRCGRGPSSRPMAGA